MSCACIYVEHDRESMTEMVYEKRVRAAFRHTCDECGRTIETGESYERALYYPPGYDPHDPEPGEDGALQSHTVCDDCLSVREEMFCGGWTWDRLWEDVGYHVDDTEGEISSECLASLTPRARMRLVEMIDECWHDLDEWDERHPPCVDGRTRHVR